MLGLAAFAAVLLYPQLRHMDSVPDLGDPLLSIWRFSWVLHKLHGDPRPLFSPNIFYPHPLTLTYSDSMLLPAITTAPFVLAGLHPVVSYNIVMVLSFIASGIAMYVLVERLTGSRAGGVRLGAAVRVLSLPVRALQPFRAADDVLHAARARGAARVRGDGAPQARGGGGPSVGGAAVQLDVLRGLLHDLRGRGARPQLLVRSRVREAPSLAGAACRGSRSRARVAAGAHLQCREARRSRGRDGRVLQRDGSGLPARASAKRDVGRANAAGPSTRASPVSGRDDPDPGRGGARAAARDDARDLRVRTRRGVRDLPRVPQRRSIPTLYEWLPFIRGLRVPARASILVGLSLAVLGGFGVRRLLASRGRWTSSIALAAIVVAIGIDLRPILRLEPVWLEPPPIYGALSGNPSAVLVEFPLGGNPRGFTANVPFMYFSLWHWTT